MKAALAHLRRADRRFHPLIERHGPPTYRRTTNSFRSLVRSIVGQQLSPAAAQTIYTRVVGLWGGRLPAAARVADTPIETLRSAGLSNAKALAVLDLAAHFADGRLSGRRLGRWDDERIATELVRVRGIGPWSVDMFLMFALTRPDVLPVGDLGVKKGMRRFFGLAADPDAATMHELAAPWRPFRSAASWYMWRVNETPAVLSRGVRGARRRAPG